MTTSKISSGSVPRRQEVAHGVLCSWPNLNNFFFRLGTARREEGSRFFVVFFLHQPTTHFRSRYRINPRSTLFVSGKASKYRWRLPKFHVDPWSRGERLLVMSCALCPNPKNAYFLPSEMDRDFLLSVFFTPAVKRFFPDAWQAPAIYYRPTCDLCDARVSRSP